MKNRGLIITIIILVICVLGLFGFIIYDKVLSDDVLGDGHVNDNNSDNNNIVDNEETKEDEKIDNITSYNVIANSPNDFIKKMADIEKVLENKAKYVVSFSDLKFTVYKNEIAPENFDNIIITYKDKMINKSNVISGSPGYHTLKSYYFDKESGLFLLTFLVAPQPAVGATYIIAFDNDGNVYMDEILLGSIEVNSKNYTLLHSYSPWTGQMCSGSDMDSMEIASETILYEYKNDTLEIKNKETVLVKDLPECAW